MSVSLMHIRNNLRSALKTRQAVMAPPTNADLRRAIDRAVRDLTEHLELQWHDPNQMMLIEPEIGRTRSGDPDTSHEAAASIPSHKLSKIRRAVLLALGRSSGPMTDEAIVSELFQFGYHQAYSTIRTRRKECVEMGWVEDSAKRVRTIGGRSLILWAITDAGHSILGEL